MSPCFGDSGVLFQQHSRRCLQGWVPPPQPLVSSQGNIPSPSALQEKPVYLGLLQRAGLWGLELGRHVQGKQP